MLKIFKNKEDIIVNKEKQILIRNYHNEVRDLCGDYRDDFYNSSQKGYLKYIQLTKLINNLTDIKNRIEELEKVGE